MDTRLDIIIFIILTIVYPIWFHCKDKYYSKKTEEKALIEDSQEIEYAKKRGEDLATTEDIKEITLQLETVKNENSFENKNNNNFINQRTKRLVKILYLTEILNEYQGILLYDLYDEQSSKRLTSLIEKINNTLLQFIHECRIIFITVKDEGLNKRISNLTKSAKDYAGYMCYIASNAVSHLNNWNGFMNIATKNDNNVELIQFAIESKNFLLQTRQEFEKNIKSKRDPLHKCQIKYMPKLNIMFGSNFHIKG